MNIRITEFQFKRHVYGNYHGETMAEIAKDFGINQPTLSQLKSRHQDDWKRMKQEIRTSEIIKYVFENKQNITPTNTLHKK